MGNVRVLDLTVDQDGNGGLDNGLELGILLVAMDLEQTDIVLAVAAASEFGSHCKEWIEVDKRAEAMQGDRSKTKR